MCIKTKLFSILLLSSTPVIAVVAGNEEIQRLLQQGTFEKALVLTEEQLTKNPDEVQTLFLKGLILAKMDRLKESASVFIDLTEKHPKLPEPYNNLAVVYAANGDYDKAEAALHQAINTHPSYATAHKNLGDIYAKMAAQAYNNALKLDSNNKGIKKLSMVSDLISAPEPVAVTQKLEALHPEPKSLAQNESEPVPTSKKTEIKPTPTTVLEHPFDKAAAGKEVRTALNTWAEAWSAKNITKYVNSYSAKFVPPNKLSRSKWQEQRHVRLNNPRFIKISLDHTKIEILDQAQALARFVQTYESDSYKDEVNKQLLLNKIDGAWLISREESN